MNSPKVSIIMPAYNAEKTIEQSVNSVLAQSYQNWELIIVDDASKDGTAGLVDLLTQKDERIVLLVNEENSGAAKSRNRGINHAKGSLLAFLDSDDLWREDKLAKQIEFMEEVNADISYTATSYMNEAGEISDFILRAKRKLTYKELLKRNLMSCSSVMVRRDVMIPFPTEPQLHEDYVVWLAILRTKCAYGLDEPLLIYRMAEGTKSSNRLASAKMIFNAYRHPLVGFNRLAAAFLTLRYAFHSIGKRMRI